MKWVEILNKLEKKKCFIFSVEEFCAFVGGSKLAAKRLLQRYAKMGLVVRVKKGMYVVAAKKPPDIFIANKLYQPSYISFEYALSYYHLIPETVYAITSATTKTTRRLEALGQNFTYSKIKTKAFTGYLPQRVDDYTILLAEPEKALADYLYFVALKKIKRNERLDVSEINAKRFYAFVRLYENKKLLQLAKEII